MSPAPTRARPTGEARFPYRWGYGLGVLLMIAGVIFATVMIYNAVVGFSDDVRALQRVASGDELLVDLEEGEYLVFDEDGLDLGPFGVRVFRTSDGREVPTTTITDGTTYDVDGLEGRARVAFDVPSDDQYRVELDTSLGELAGFAVGGDVGNDRVNGIIRGLVVGAVLAVAGFITLIVTLAFHARWRLRNEVLQRAQTARDMVGEATAPSASPESRREAATQAAQQGTSWARERLDRARERIPTVPGDHGRPPTLRERVAIEATKALDAVDQTLETVEPAVSDAAAQTDAPAELADRIDAALGRVQERVRAGDRLRDIAADERAEAERAAAELAAQLEVARTDAAAQVDELQSEVAGRVREEMQDQREQVAEVGIEKLDAIVADTQAAGDDLIAGAAATAGGTLAAGAEAARLRARDLAGPPPTDAEAPRPAAYPPPPPLPQVEPPLPVVELPPLPPSVDEWRAEQSVAPPAPPVQPVAPAARAVEASPAEPSVDMPAAPRQEPADALAPGPVAAAPPPTTRPAEPSILRPPPVARALEGQALVMPDSPRARARTEPTRASGTVSNERVLEPSSLPPSPSVAAPFVALSPPPHAGRDLPAPPALHIEPATRTDRASQHADAPRRESPEDPSSDGSAAEPTDDPPDEHGLARRSFSRLAPPPDYGSAIDLDR